MTEEIMMHLSDIRYLDLICLAFRHRWIPVAGRAGVVAGKRTILWQLSCESGCDCTASEWRFLDGTRVPGTQRQYSYTKSYSQSTGYSQGEYIAEIHRRQKAEKRVSQNRAG